MHLFLSVPHSDFSELALIPRFTTDRHQRMNMWIKVKTLPKCKQPCNNTRSKLMSLLEILFNNAPLYGHLPEYALYVFLQTHPNAKVYRRRFGLRSSSPYLYSN